MQKYILYIKEEAKNDSSFTNPNNILNTKMCYLLKAIEDEMNFILLKHFIDSNINIKEQISILKKMYFFNSIVEHAYNWWGGNMIEDDIISSLKGHKNILDKIKFSCQETMCDYTFYDGTPCQEIYDELIQLKEIRCTEMKSKSHTH